ncbi:MAG: AAA family ATPase, partial [Bacteroidales bacterium]|nr:AAA family ATPase [Bacteroidales bacterium]
MTEKKFSYSHDSSISDLLHLDQENQIFNFALEFILNHPQPVFITGKAGTGKTTFLKQLRRLAGPNTIVLAPTGVA